ncbi:hypothetical protein L210DRAFT_946304 [Boletus edulis BED1]|uniref:Uncharacterized protein n=1 Tax=Boletus edulis BED1 TaxID=1328754 RepID=A0AAD4BRQ5_BOLED|nr:hypothetical protein L210DRAFT_946304 [Boletus edulis BED1]
MTYTSIASFVLLNLSPSPSTLLDFSPIASPSTTLENSAMYVSRALPKSRTRTHRLNEKELDRTQRQLTFLA